MPQARTEARAMSDARPAEQDRAARMPGWRRLVHLHGFGPFLGLVLLCIAGTLLNGDFATVGNAMNEGITNLFAGAGTPEDVVTKMKDAAATQ